jgi:hypothetical protein
MQGGEVLIAISNDILSTPVPELQTDCEIVWAKISLVGRKDMYIASYYNPTTSNEDSLDELGLSLERANTMKNAFKWSEVTSIFQVGIGIPEPSNQIQHTRKTTTNMVTCWMIMVSCN